MIPEKRAQPLLGQSKGLGHRFQRQVRVGEKSRPGHLSVDP